ncbi:MAG TPA: TonB-dependent receptor [Rhodanobacter sp.]|nr:TonB-dependent receptor [Rhodanobacter sp.]
MNIHNYRRRRLAFSIIATLAAGQLPLAHAQDTTAPASSGQEADKQVTTLSQITVRAQKREELLQDVPITMATLPEQLLQDTGVRDIKDLQTLVPTLFVTSTTSETQTTARIRGVGTVGDNPGLESSVGIVIDGVPRARNGVAFGDLGELEQIEVLKGPQGTVFGKNTSAGLINVITKRPSFKEEGNLEFTAGNYGAVGVAGSYNNKLSDYAAFRIYAADRKRDGFNDVNTGVGPRTLKSDGDQGFHSIRTQLLLTPSSNLEVNIIGDYTQRNENCCVGVTVVRGPTAAIVNALAGGNGVIPAVDIDKRLAYNNRDTTQKITDKGLSTEVNWNTSWFGNATLTSITALRKWDAIVGTDLDFSGADIWYRPYGAEDNSVRFKTFSQELRLAGNTDRVDWMVGLYYDNEKLQRHDAVTLGAAYEPYLSTALLNDIAKSFPPGLVNTAGAATFLSQASGRPYGTSFVGAASRDHWNQDAKSTAAFGNATFHATDKLALTLGLRYTHENKSVDSYYTNPNGGLGCAAGLGNPARVGGALAARGVPAPYIAAIVPTVIGYMCLPWANPMFNGRTTTQDFTANEWSGTLKAAYRWSDGVMTYASAARGYKAGGFNLDRVQSGNGRNDGPQGIVPVTDTSFPGEFVDSYELGTKTSWRDGNLLLNAALFHSKYTDFQLNSFLGTSYVVRSVPELTTKGVDADMLWQTRIPGLSLQGGATYTDAKYGNDLLPDPALAHVPGNTAGFAPKWALTGGVTYQWNFNDYLMGRLNVGAKHMTEYNTGSDLNPTKMQPAYTLLNARLVVGAISKRWQVELWGNNLTDRTYKQVGFDAPIQPGSINAFLGAPRTFGLTVRGAL